MTKNLIRETLKEIEEEIHGTSEDGFTPMEAQMIYNTLEDFMFDALEKQKKQIVELVKKHHKQNTYEGDEALLYHTTIDEIILLLNI